jgi:RNA polymerase sigma-70 factor (TIGR02960 family)
MASDPAGAVLAQAAADGDKAAFDELAGLHRRELHVHCYRMLASFDDAEDAVQEALLRAWRGREGLSRGPDALSRGPDGLSRGPEYRAWLFRIATNVCLDMLRQRSRQAASMTTYADVPWLQPYPDPLLDEAAGDGPADVVIGRETVELAFLAALQVLPPRQRAALIVRDVLGWPAADTAGLLGISVAAANSAVQRARSQLREHLPPRRADWRARRPSAAERELLAQFIEAHERYDPAAIVRISAADIRVTMPPYPHFFEGLAGMAPLFERAFGPGRDGDWRLLPAAANRMPAAGSYLRRPGDTLFRPFKLDVLRVDDGLIREITTFGPVSFPALGLPPELR